MQFPEPGHQRRDVPTPEAGRRGDAQVAAGLDAALGDAGFRVGHVGQQALAVFQKGTALVGQGDAPRGAHQQLDAQVFFQRIEPPTHDRGRHALGLGGRGQAALGGNGDKGFERLELVHVRTLCR
jgi:hypothetical protein